jgi:hypothetical protein
MECDGDLIRPYFVAGQPRLINASLHLISALESKDQRLSRFESRLDTPLRQVMQRRQSSL